MTELCKGKGQGTKLFLPHLLLSLLRFSQWLVGQCRAEEKTVPVAPGDRASLRGGNKKSHWLASTDTLGGAPALLGGPVASWAGAPGEWAEHDGLSCAPAAVALAALLQSPLLLLSPFPPAFVPKREHPPPAPTHVPSPTPLFPSPSVLCLPTLLRVYVWGTPLPLRLITLRQGSKSLYRPYRSPKKPFPGPACDHLLLCTGTGETYWLQPRSSQHPHGRGVGTR